MMKKYLFITVISLLVLLSSCQQRNAGQKELQWRGENRDGVYHETGLLKEWPPDGPELLWHFEGLGNGFTSAAIAGGKLFITGLDEDDLILFVFDLTGKLLAKKAIGKEWSGSHPGPRSTITVNDGKLYVYTALGTLLCLDEASLLEVWSRDLVADFGARKIQWNYTESPLIVGEKIFITPGGEEHNFIALNKNTGALIWSSPGKGSKSAYCSPKFIDGYSVSLIVTSTADYIIAVNADTGELLWDFPRTNKWGSHPNTPHYHNGMIFSTSGHGEGSVMLRLIDGGKAVEQVWHNTEMDNEWGGAVRIDNYIYGAGHTKPNWYCLDWNTGETKYAVREIGQSNVIDADGMLYVYTTKGNMHLIKPNPDSLEIVSSFAVTMGTEIHISHSVIHDGVLYIRHGDALMAYKIK